MPKFVLVAFWGQILGAEEIIFRSQLKSSCHEAVVPQDSIIGHSWAPCRAHRLLTENALGASVLEQTAFRASRRAQTFRSFYLYVLPPCLYKYIYYLYLVCPVCPQGQNRWPDSGLSRCPRSACRYDRGDQMTCLIYQVIYQDLCNPDPCFKYNL